LVFVSAEPSVAVSLAELLGLLLPGVVGSGGRAPRGDRVGSFEFFWVLGATLLVEGRLPLTVTGTQVPARGLGRCCTAGCCLPLELPVPDELSLDEVSADDPSVLRSSLSAFISVREF
jgi:hypothetical protein